MISERTALALLAVLSTGCPPPLSTAAAAEAPGGSGWVLEHFSDDVTILRTAIPTTQPSPQASLTLSCAGRDQRFRLAVPGRAGEVLGGAGDGAVLVSETGFPGSRKQAVVARFTRPNADTLVIAGRGDAASGGTVVAIARMLAEQRGGLALLLHTGGGTVTLPGLTAYHLPLPPGARDAAAFRDFIEVCSRKPPRR